MNVPQAVKELRGALRLSQQDFSNRLGLTVTSVSRYETGSSAPVVGALRQMMHMAREIGRADLARVFVFGQDETADLGMIGAELLSDVEAQFLQSASSKARELARICGASNDPHAAKLAADLSAELQDARQFIADRLAE